MRLIRWETGEVAAEETIGERNASIEFHPNNETIAVACSWQGGSEVRFFNLMAGRLERLDLKIKFELDFI